MLSVKTAIDLNKHNKTNTEYFRKLKCNDDSKATVKYDSHHSFMGMFKTYTCQIKRCNMLFFVLLRTFAPITLMMAPSEL